MQRGGDVLVAVAKSFTMAMRTSPPRILSKRGQCRVAHPTESPDASSVVSSTIIVSSGIATMKSMVVSLGYAGGVEAGSPGCEATPGPGYPMRHLPRQGLQPPDSSHPCRGTEFHRRPTPRVRASHDPGLSAETPPAYRFPHLRLGQSLPVCRVLPRGGKLGSPGTPFTGGGRGAGGGGTRPCAGRESSSARGAGPANG